MGGDIKSSKMNMADNLIKSITFIKTDLYMKKY